MSNRCDHELTTQSHDSHSFVAVRYLRRLEIGNLWLLTEVMHELIDCLQLSGDFIEWTECDEILATRLSMYIQRIGAESWGFGIVSRWVCSVGPATYAAWLTLEKELHAPSEDLRFGFYTKPDFWARLGRY